MGLTVEVTVMAQELNLEDGSMAHFLVLRLPSGVVIKALISDESAQAIVYANINGTTPPSMDETSVHRHEVSAEPDNVIFGGDVPPQIPIVPVQTKPRTRPLIVEKNSAGYPIIRNNGATNPLSVQGEVDEDGATPL